ncbi:MAG: type I glyceraldehyde-3-phosphate dehydrogenase [Nanoarchaeota archaeon]
MNIAINGFGRIGRSVVKIALDQGINVKTINDIHGPKDAAYLLKYDSIYGKYSDKIKANSDSITVNGKKIRVISEMDPAKLPWKKHKIDIVVEATGVFRNPEEANKHKTSGAKYVIITAPCKEGKPDITLIPGVNQDQLQKEHEIISLGSCTTNCLVPVVKVLHDKFKIKRALFTTVHAYTNDQNIHDSSHKKIRRGRAAALNMIPTTTGAAESVIEVMPELLGKINGLAIRIPVAVGSLLDIVAEVKSKINTRKVNNAFKSVSQNKLKGIIEYSEEELVSSDIIKNPNSAVIDSLSTQVDGNLVKVLAWYDNEYGYSCRVIDLIKILKKWTR